MLSIRNALVSRVGIAKGGDRNTLSSKEVVPKSMDYLKLGLERQSVKSLRIAIYHSRLMRYHHITNRSPGV